MIRVTEDEIQIWHGTFSYNGTDKTHIGNMIKETVDGLEEKNKCATRGRKADGTGSLGLSAY